MSSFGYHTLTMFKILSIFIILTGNLTNAATDNVPYLVINTTDRQYAEAIIVTPGQNVSINCTVNPSYHSVLWQWKNKQTKPFQSTATLNLFNIADTDSGIYTCKSPSINLKKKVRIITKTRSKRDLELPPFPDTGFTLDELLRLRKENNDDWISHDLNFWDDSHDLNHWHSDFNERNWKDIDSKTRLERTLEYRRKTKEELIRNVGIVVGVIIISAAVIAITYSICKRITRIGNQPTINNSPPHRTNIEQRPLNTSNFTPSERINVSIPSAPICDFDSNRSRLRGVETDTTPPPSYEEAISNVQPTPCTAKV